MAYAKRLGFDSSEAPVVVAYFGDDTPASYELARRFGITQAAVLEIIARIPREAPLTDDPEKKYETPVGGKWVQATLF